MTLFVCWIVFPAVLGALSLGCGLLTAQIARTPLPAELLLPVGLATIVVVSLFTTLTAATARLTTPAVLALAAVGIASALPLRAHRADLWAAGATIATFAVFATPIVLAGEATFAGYVKLDDTATFLALLDRALEHGRSLAGLAPSSYEATLAINLPFYPLGSLLPLGIGATVVGQDTAWVFQPYLAFLAAMLALALYRLAGLVIDSRSQRAFAAFLAAQAALLYGYALWGGVKELAAAALVALAAALAGARPEQVGLATLVPLLLAAAALIGVLSVGAVLYLVPVVGVVAVTVVRGRATLRPAFLLGTVAALLLPSLAVAGLVLDESVLSSVRDEAELGNLLGPLSPLQLAGIWPAGDFRLRPDRMDVTYVLVAMVALSAAAGVLVAAARRAWGLPLYLAATLGAALVYAGLGSPWIEAKAFAIAAPAVVLAALVAAFALFAGRRVEGAVVVGVIALGIAWSNALAYGDLTLAPREQLAELEEIGERFTAQGPALMTEYQPYGVRHFLRELDPEGASELRRRLVPLKDGTTLPKGRSADLAAFRPETVLAYRTLVLRRSPTATGPPTPYARVWQRRFYEVWQRPENVPVASVDRRRCAKPLSGTTVLIPVPGRYELWVGGSVRGELTALVDGRAVGRVRHQLNYAGQHTSAGQVDLAAGSHTLETRHRLSRFRPGEGGEAWTTGPLLVTPTDRCN